MTIDGLGTPTPGAPGLAGPRPASTTLPLADALALLGLSADATVEEARAAVRSALATLQSQVSAGSVDSSAFRAKAAALTLALNTVVATRPPAASPVGTLATAVDTVDVHGLTVPRPSAVPPAAPGATDVDPVLGRTPPGTGSPSATPPGPRTPVTPTPVTPTPLTGTPTLPTAATTAPTSISGMPATAGEPGATAGPDAPEVQPQPQPPAGVRLPSSGQAPSGSLPTPTSGVIGSPAATPTAPLSGPAPTTSAAPSAPVFDPDPAVALSVLPLLAHRPPTAAQIDLWSAAVLPNVAQHVDAARTAASDAGARTEQQLAAATTYGVLTQVLTSLPHERRRELQVLAMGVYDQLEAALPYAVVAGLPPRDHLGLLSFHALLPSTDFKPALLLLVGALVALALWAGLR